MTIFTIDFWKFQLNDLKNYGPKKTLELKHMDHVTYVDNLDMDQLKQILHVPLMVMTFEFLTMPNEDLRNKQLFSLLLHEIRYLLCVWVF